MVRLWEFKRLIVLFVWVSMCLGAESEEKVCEMSQVDEN